MKKEIIIVVIIIIAIVAIDRITQNHTKNSFANINNKLVEIKEIGKDIENSEKESSRQLIQETENKKQELKNKIEEMEKEWRKINKRTAFYIEHDELEKVNTSMAKFKEYFELEEYTEAIPELESCKYILNHIKDKEAMQFINLF